MQQQPVVLITDDDPNTRQNVRKALSKEGFAFNEASDSNELKARLEKESIDIVILDLQMPDFDGEFSLIAGIECLKYIRRNHGDIPVIILTDFKDPSREIIREALKFGAFDYIVKTGLGAQAKLVKRTKEAYTTPRKHQLNDKSNSVNTDEWPSLPVTRTIMRKTLNTYFTDNDLRDVCFDLGIDYESLLGNAKSGKARELISECERLGRVSDLIEICCEMRPNISWCDKVDKT